MLRSMQLQNTDPPKPSCKPTATARAVTVAEWDDGIPPDATSCFRSQHLSLYLQDYYSLKTSKNNYHNLIGLLRHWV